MKKYVVVTFVIALIAIGLPAFAGLFTLHPAGFGPQSFASWKAQEGLDDPGNGLPQQALYFQKFTSTATVAAGVAVFKGFTGLRVEEITGLEWKHRDDGHCGAGAPRWNIISRDPVTGKRYITFLGCAAAAHTTDGTSVNKSGTHTWITDRQDLLTATCAPFDPDAPPVASCATFSVAQFGIVFDEGTDQGQGFVFLDDITVEANGVRHVWHSASDNSSNSTALIPALGPGIAAASDLLPPTDPVPASQILADLVDMFPRVPLTEFMLYPDVLP